MSMEPDFYIGYLPQAPSGLRRFLRRLIVAIGLMAVVLAVVFAVAQMPFANSFFEFGKLRHFEGTLTIEPYPALLVNRPGQAGSNAGTSEYLLVAPGKHGADDLIKKFVGKEVRLRGQLIFRDENTILEIEPGSIRPLNAGGRKNIPVQDLGSLTLSGEIVDSKCYLGVMNPGNGKVHRDCASRCLSGGIPPLFVEFASGKTFLLVEADTSALSYKDISEFVAEPLTVTGEHILRGDQHLLSINPRELRHPD
jgi:hypothetical protein